MTTPIDFGDKQYDYGAGYPAPFSLPETTVCRTFQIPASEENAEWLAIFMGLLLSLTDPANWVQFEGAMYPEDVAQRWLEMVDQAYDDAQYGCMTSVPAPYWDEDSADDADDEMPPEMQPWYGELLSPPEGLTFVEQLEYWGITAFVAVTATPAAAITFTVLAKKFVLAWQSHNLGGIARVFVDASEIAQIDTYSATDGVTTLNVYVPEAATALRAEDVETHTLWIAMSEDINPAVVGTPSLRVLRKRLSEAEVSPSNIRYNPDCDCIQQTPDGVTWVDNPTADPRHSDILRFPPRGGEDAKCSAAANMVERVRLQIDQIVASLTMFTLVNGLMAVAAIFMPEIAVVLAVAEAFGLVLIDIGTSAIDSAFNNDTYDALLCIFYCNIGADGQVSAEQLNDIILQIHDELNPIVYDVLWFMLGQFWGEVGLSNAGTLGDETGDCDDCECTTCIQLLGGYGRGDLEVQTNDDAPACSAAQWGMYNAEEDRFEATWCGLSNSFRENWLKLAVGGALITSVSMTFDQDWTRQTQVEASIYADEIQVLLCNSGSCFHNTITWTPDTPTSIDELWFVSAVSTFGDDGYSYITAIEICVKE